MSDQENIDAIVLAALEACGGTVRYGACDADCEGDRVALALGNEHTDPSGDGFLSLFRPCVGGIGVAMFRSSSPSSDDSEVTDASSPNPD